jgi:hypothetical protein
MAVWQFDLRIVPRERVRLFLDADGDCVRDAVLDSVEWWRGEQLPVGWERQLESVLPRSPSWDNDWMVFGSEDGTRVDVLTDNGALQEVRLRVDARELDPALLERLMHFASSAGCRLVTPTGRVIEPDAIALWVELELSPARQFVRDPAAFLDGLQRRRKAVE